MADAHGEEQDIAAHQVNRLKLVGDDPPARFVDLVCGGVGPHSPASPLRSPRGAGPWHTAQRELRPPASSLAASPRTPSGTPVPGRNLQGEPEGVHEAKRVLEVEERSSQTYPPHQSPGP